MLSKPSDEMPKPPRKEQVSANSTNTILIIIIVVLVGIVGVAAGYILFGNVNHPTATNNTTNTTPNSTNQTNITNTTPINNTTTTQTPTTQGGNIITPNEALADAIAFINNKGGPGGSFYEYPGTVPVLIDGGNMYEVTVGNNGGAQVLVDLWSNTGVIEADHVGPDNNLH